MEGGIDMIVETSGLPRSTDLHQAVSSIAALSFPHNVSQQVYSHAADVALDVLQSDPPRFAMVVSGLADWFNGSDTNSEMLLAFLERESDAAWFRDLRQLIIPTIYGDPEVWTRIGYEGPSFELGGYKDRGFDDLTWLPEPELYASAGEGELK